MFRHWVRSNVEYTDYPYAKFDIHLDQVTYSNEEYLKYLKNDSWSKSETDKLMEVCRKFELRWPVIHDRWIDYCHSQESESPFHRKVEDLQHRYYSVAAILSQNRYAQEAAAEVQELSAASQDVPVDTAKEIVESMLMETAAAKALAAGKARDQPLAHNLGTGSSNKTFDLSQERERRSRVHELWNRCKKDEMEENALRKELRLVEAQLRKMKKTGGHILAASLSSQGVAGSKLSSAASSTSPSRSVSPVPGSNIVESPALLDQCFASTAPVPMPKTPYLQSGRMLPPATGGSVGLNKTLLNRMDSVLAELKVPMKPIATKRVCDVYDRVRKDVLTLLSLRKLLLQKEGNLQAKRVKLAKLSGTGRIMDEEALLGIAPSSASSLATNTASRGKGARASKTKASASAGKSKSVSSSNAPKGKAEDQAKTEGKDSATTTASAKKTKSSVKRKRKSESKSPAPATGDKSAPTATPAAATTATPSAALSNGNQSTLVTDPKPSGGTAGSKKRIRKT